VLLGIGVGQIIAGIVGPRLLRHVSPRTMLGVSLALQGAFMLPALWATSDSRWLIPLIITQFVNAFFSMTAALCFVVIATSSVDADEQGMATGMATQSQQVGIAIGIPLVSAAFAAVLGRGTRNRRRGAHRHPRGHRRGRLLPARRRPAAETCCGSPTHRTRWPCSSRQAALWPSPVLTGR
jgi:MFS family permease